MGTRFAGHKTGFNTKGSNDVTPNFMGPPVTKFCGRGALPDGALKRYPGAVADIEGGNRRLAKSNHGGGGDASGGVSYRGHPSGFRMDGGSTGKPSKAYDTKGGRGSGFRKDGKKP